MPLLAEVVVGGAAAVAERRKDMRGSTGGAATIMHEEGFGDDSEAVVDERFVKVVLRKREGGSVTSELTERGTTLWNDEEKIVRWLWGQAKVRGLADPAKEVARLLSRDHLYRQEAE